MSKVIGIDLGTTYSRVAVWHDNRVEVIPNNHGNRFTPSCVAFAGAHQMIGDSALSQLEANPENSIINAKRLLGRQLTDPLVQRDTRMVPFQVVGKGRPRIRVEYKDVLQTFMPDDITAALLSDLRESAEAYLGTCAKDVVISVPACFTPAQCHATLAAAQLAGLNVLQLISDATATGYCLDQDASNQTALIIDLGGGTLDVSLLQFGSAGSFEVLATAGNSHLGGIDFDDRLFTHLLALFHSQHDVDISANTRAIQRLRVACERAKRSLSTATVATIEIDAIVDNTNFTAQITRQQLEELCVSLFDQVLKQVKAMLRTSGIPRNKVDKVVLVGGSTRIPKLRQIVAGFFGNTPLSTPDNLDETVVVGAAVQAAYLSSGVSNQVKDNILTEANMRSVSASYTPLSKCR
ncbi:Hsp70 chaperone [Coemansia furcata]|uniref:Hsp70 chaperone n=1 Tax=Coemansia furcata TaxID=417177 RepID=A0ACC1LJN3_9FUNG|nr:Hsp70 chaperone [Coemansia furcata]